MHAPYFYLLTCVLVIHTPIVHTTDPLQAINQLLHFPNAHILTFANYFSLNTRQMPR